MANCTGRQLLKNPTVMQSVVNARKAGASISKIARNFGYSRDTIRAALAQPESSQFTQGTIARLERIVTKGLARYEAALDSGKVSPNSIPIHAGIALDKRANLLNESSNNPPEQTGISVDSILEELRSLPVQVQVNVQVNTNEPARHVPMKGAAPK
jgi:hypothetical protein